MGVVTVQVLGDNCYAKNGKQVNCLSVLRFKNVPPFVEFKVDETTGNILTVAIKLPSVVFDEDNSVSAIGWQLIMPWLKKVLGTESRTFLQSLTLSYPTKEFLLRGGIKNKQKTADLEKHLKYLVSIQCEYERHVGITGKPTTILRAEVDESFFKRNGRVYCCVCTLNMRESSLDGFLYKDHVLPLLHHLKESLDEKFLPGVKLLINAFQVTRDHVLYYQHNKVWDNAVCAQHEYKYNDPKSLLATGVNLCWVVAKKAWADFGIRHKNQTNVRKFFQCLAKYKVWGKAEFNELAYSPAWFKNVQTVKNTFSIDAFRLVVISVFEPSLVKLIFREAGNGYVHVYRDISDRLTIPGVDSVDLNSIETYLAHQPTRTIVAWPAHFFTLTELADLEKYGSPENPVILAGTPYVIGTHATQGQGFTSLVDQGHPVTFYGPNTPVSRQIEGQYPPKPIPVTFLSTPRHTQHTCPTYVDENNGQRYYHHSLLFTLLSKLSHSPLLLSSLTIVPGALHFSNDAELALCGD